MERSASVGCQRKGCTAMDTEKYDFGSLGIIWLCERHIERPFLGVLESCSPIIEGHGKQSIQTCVSVHPLENSAESMGGGVFDVFC